MKKPDEVSPTDEGFSLDIRPRPGTTVNLHIPDDVLASLTKVAAGRDMSVEALLKLYIGKALREDLAKLFADRVLEKTAQVLTRHLQSEEEVSAILSEIRVETAQ
jgi:hypothetical protein